MRTAVNVVVYWDRSYAVHATTMVRSLLDNAAPDCDVDLYVLGVDLTAEVIATAQASWPADRLTVHWITVDLDPYTREFGAASYPPAAYSRLLIDRLLPDDVARVISLDSDGLVLDDIGALWRQAPAQGCVSAVVDLTVLRLGNDRSPFAQQLDLYADAPYFNSGVMVIDLARWRQMGITSRCLDLARRHPAQSAFADQSLLNVVLRGRWEPLPFRWNCQASSIAESGFPTFRGRFVTTAEVRDAARRPGFVHFVGRRKPWNALSDHPHALQYWQYRSRTQWAAPTTAVAATTGRRAHRWYRRKKFLFDRYRRVQDQARIHQLRRHRVADVAHLAVAVVGARNPGRHLDDRSTPFAPLSLTRSVPMVKTVSRSLRGHVRAADPREPVDALYLWVDGAAPGTRTRLAAALARCRPDLPGAAVAGRFRDHDELRYSLRSLEQFAPWVRRVHVVTDGDPPPWLALGDRCVHVTHDQIFSDPSCLPSFNSLAIESQLHRVPGLSRRFLYFNDDMFLGRPVRRDHYLRGGGRQVVYLDQGAVPGDDAGDVIGRALAHTARATRARWGQGAVVGFFSHTPQLLDCELLAALEALWPEDYHRTSRSTFRAPDDLVLGVLYPAAAVAGRNGSAPALPQVLRYGSAEYSFVQFGPNPFESMRDLGHLERARPRFICVNDDLGSGALSDRLAVCLRETLERMYPVPSRYELHR
jgi:lipopolysaccharide biosynthesis glycosyltransferase